MSTEQSQPEVINDAVQMHCDGAVGWVVLTRPGQINAINDAIRVGVPAALERLENNESIHVIVIRPVRANAGFAPGQTSRKKRGPETSIQVRKRMEGARWIEAIDAVSKPGHCPLFTGTAWAAVWSWR